MLSSQCEKYIIKVLIMRVASNLLADIRRFYVQELRALYPQSEAESLFDWAAEEILQQPRSLFRAQSDLRVSESELLRFFETAKRLRKGEPVQYIFSRAYFDDMVLEVNPSVLIPRPETEQLVGLAASDVLQGLRSAAPLGASDAPLRIWDACTGSGCVALALERRLGGGCKAAGGSISRACGPDTLACGPDTSAPRVEICGSDVSNEALAVARRNAERYAHGGVDSVQFISHNLLSDAPVQGPWQLIISNPPYVMESEKALMRPNVLQYEPALALFVPDHDALRFYEALGRAALATLAADGVLWAEINEAQADALSALYHRMGFSSVEIHRDFRDRPRFVRVQKNV